MKTPAGEQAIEMKITHQDLAGLRLVQVEFDDLEVLESRFELLRGSCVGQERAEAVLESERGQVDADLSRITLHAGDVIATGTPPGVGVHSKPMNDTRSAM